MAETNPFVLYRERLDSYGFARERGMTDRRFVELVERFDDALAAVDGHGFCTSPVTNEEKLAVAAGLDIDLWVKSDVESPGGSHKSRHLFGVALHLLVAKAFGIDRSGRLAIASCGNAALAAAIMAQALDRSLEVYVPTWAEASVIDRLNELGATINVCERRDDEVGDPCYLRFLESVAAGAVPFSVQAVDTPTTLDGGRTLGWELADQVADLDAIYIQVGGGALATAVSLGLGAVALHPVQAEGCAPLQRAWEALEPGFDFEAAAANPGAYMWPWESEPTSAASGILDDVAYDWLPLLERTRVTGGAPIVAPESEILRAHELALANTDVMVSITGSAGLAGLMTAPPPNGARVAVLFTGVENT